MKASASSNQPYRVAERCAIQAMTKVSPTTTVADIAASVTLVFTAERKIG